MSKRAAIAGLSLTLVSFQVAGDAGTASKFSGLDPLQTSLSLLLVVLIIVVCLLLLRRYGSFTAAPAQPLRIIAALSLGQRERVVILEAGRKQLVLGVCPGRIETLCTLEGEDRLTTEPHNPTSPDFMNTLRQMLQQPAK